MKKSRFRESQIAVILKEVDSGIVVGEVIRQHGISSASTANESPSTGI